MQLLSDVFSGYSPGLGGSSTFTVTGTTTIDVGQSELSTQFTGTVTTEIGSGPCYSNLAVPTVLKRSVSTGQPSDDITITTSMLVTAPFIEIQVKDSGTSQSSDPSSSGSSDASASQFSDPAASISSDVPTSSSSRASTSRSSRSSHATTVLPSDEPSSQSSNASATGAATDPLTHSPRLSKVGIISLAVAIPVVILALLLWALILFSRRRKRKTQQLPQPLTALASHPELETRQAQNPPYPMLDSDMKYELDGDYHQNELSAEPTHQRSYSSSFPAARG